MEDLCAPHHLTCCSAHPHPTPAHAPLLLLLCAHSLHTSAYLMSWQTETMPTPPLSLPLSCSCSLVDILSSGQYFGEYSCLLGEPQKATMVAGTYCELYRYVRAGRAVHWCVLREGAGDYQRTPSWTTGTGAS